MDCIIDPQCNPRANLSETLFPGVFVSNFIVMQLPAIIFDLDGTLIDSKEDLTLAVNALLDELGYSGLSVDRVASFIGDGTPKLAERALKYVGAIKSSEDEKFQNLYQKLLAHYEANLSNKTRIFPGVYSVLGQLSHHPLAVVTNKPHRFTLPVLEAFDLAHYFTFVAGGDTFPRKKPDPLPLEEAMTSLQVTAAETLMVGDGDTDILAGQAAGVTTVAALYGNRSPDALHDLNPDYTITHFSELLSIIYQNQQDK